MDHLIVSTFFVAAAGFAVFAVRDAINLKRIVVLLQGEA